MRTAQGESKRRRRREQMDGRYKMKNEKKGIKKKREKNLKEIKKK